MTKHYYAGLSVYGRSSSFSETLLLCISYLNDMIDHRQNKGVNIVCGRPTLNLREESGPITYLGSIPFELNC